MSRVVVPQQPMRWNEKKQEMVPSIDLRPANVYGEVVCLVGPNAGPWSPNVIQEVRDKLEDFDPRQDYLLPVGNSALVGATFAMTVQRHGGLIRILRWSGGQRGYVVFEMDLREGKET